MIAYYSNLAMVTSAVLYLLAMTLHAAEWASARGTQVETKALVGVPAGAPAPSVPVVDPGAAGS
ncbi:MAG: c-type cytochrome biogenesis protein CcsB, partial [Propionicimonas sp.]